MSVGMAEGGDVASVGDAVGTAVGEAVGELVGSVENTHNTHTRARAYTTRKRTINQN